MQAIKDAKDKGTMVSVHYVDDNSCFSVGFICAEDDESIILNAVSPDGENDGFMLIDRENIAMIKVGDKYTKKIERLYAMNWQTRLPHDFVEGDLAYSLLEYAQRMKLPVTIEIMDSSRDDAMGIIMDLDENYVTLAELDEYGDDNGIASIDIYTITHMCCGSVDELRAFKLSSHNN